MSALPPIEALLDQGEDHAHAGRFPQAEACAGSVLQRQPRNARAHYVMALAALFQQRFDEARERIGQALRTERTNAQYHFTEAMALAGAGRRDEAIEAYRRALQLKPQMFAALANLANQLELSGRFEQAAAAYRRALALREEPLLLNGLGVCELALGRPREAAQALARAAELQPGNATVLNNLSNAMAKQGDANAAMGLLERAVALRPDFAAAWRNLGEQRYMRRDDAGAIAAFDRVLALEPANDEVRYLRESIAGRRPERAPDAFVRNFFDRFAAEFDERLTRDLGYRGPEQLAEALRPWLEAHRGLRALDLGCGTGLSGVVIRPYAAVLAGVDLSGQMLARARERALYDELAEAEIGAYLGRCATASYDLLLAADVFVYVGRLEEIFRDAARVLAPGGLFAFSVEDLQADGEDYRLARTGRYMHAAKYLERCAAAWGFRTAVSSAVVLRHEDGKPVASRLWAFEATSRPA